MVVVAVAIFEKFLILFLLLLLFKFARAALLLVVQRVLCCFLWGWFCGCFFFVFF
jgi:hypothetical protein